MLNPKALYKLYAAATFENYSPLDDSVDVSVVKWRGIAFPSHLPPLADVTLIYNRNIAGGVWLNNGTNVVVLNCRTDHARTVSRVPLAVAGQVWRALKLWNTYDSVFINYHTILGCPVRSYFPGDGGVGVPLGTFTGIVIEDDARVRLKLDDASYGGVRTVDAVRFNNGLLNARNVPELTDEMLACIDQSAEPLRRLVENTNPRCPLCGGATQVYFDQADSLYSVVHAQPTTCFGLLGMPKMINKSAAQMAAVGEIHSRREFMDSRKG